MAKITVVTRVYNDGQYLPELMDCLADQTTEDFDWLIVDDNSDDQFTLQLLAQIVENVPDVTLLKQDPAKKGVGYANRLALENATGDYIVTLGSADKITPTYLEQAAQILDEQPTVGVIYGSATLFGTASVLREKYKQLEIPPEIPDEQVVEVDWNRAAYQFPAILGENTIFRSAMFRRADYLATPGYSEELATLHEFDLWISLTELALQRGSEPNQFFYRLPDVVYSQRVRTDSASAEQYISSYGQVYRQHKQLFNANIGVIFDKIAMLAGMK